MQEVKQDLKPENLILHQEEHIHHRKDRILLLVGLIHHHRNHILHLIECIHRRKDLILLLKDLILLQQDHTLHQEATALLMLVHPPGVEEAVHIQAVGDDK